MTTKKPVDPAVAKWERNVIQKCVGYLQEDRYRFHLLDEDCIELYMRGKNLEMRMLIYAHNRHLVVRVPGFIRGGIDLRRPEFMLALLGIMNDYFDIRLELSDDGHALSGACNHVLEDGDLTKHQFSQCMSVVAYLVDEHYPKLMRLLYGASAPLTEPVVNKPARPVEEDVEDVAADDEQESADEDESSDEDADDDEKEPHDSNGGHRLN